MEKPKFTIGNFKSSGKVLGRGSFARVFHGYQLQGSRQVAIKVVDLDRLSSNQDKLRVHLEMEIQIMKTLKHPNITELIDVQKKGSYMYLILEYCAGGDLSKFLGTQTGRRIDEVQARIFMQQLASGLKFLHDNHIIHRDLKPQNLLLSSEDVGVATLKIADFGFARFIDVQSVADTLCGSPLYMAPEILRFQKYNAQADLWSVGAILFEMLCGRPPYKCKSQFELIQLMEKTDIAIPTGISISQTCKLLIFGLLTKDPRRRLVFNEFFCHDWLEMRKESHPIGIKASSARSAVTHVGSQPSGIGIGIGNIKPVSYDQQGFLSSISPPSVSRHHSLPAGKLHKKRMGHGRRSPLPSVEEELSSSDSFEFIQSAESQKSSAFGVVFSQIQRQFSGAIAIAELADEKMDEMKGVQAFVLFVTALSVMKSVLIQLKHQPTTFSTASLLVEKARVSFSNILRQVKSLEKQAQEHTNTKCNVSKMIYEAALRMGKDAAIKEMYKNYEASKTLYQKSILLLEHIGGSKSPDAHDQDILSEHFSRFSKRLEEVLIAERNQEEPMAFGQTF